MTPKRIAQATAFLLLFCLNATPQYGNAQNPILHAHKHHAVAPIQDVQEHPCGSGATLIPPQYLQKKEAQERAISNWQRNHLAVRSAAVTIPVVVHIVHAGEAVGTGSNVSEAQILQQIASLNEDFNALNTDKLAASHPFYPLIGNAQVSFCIARQDPNGYTTTGITRTQRGASLAVQTTSANLKSTAAGGKDNWNPTKYLNIWVYAPSQFTTLNGFSSAPIEMSYVPEWDGVAIQSNVFGVNANNTPQYNKGRTLTHEVGHWLNLIHPWGDAVCGDDLVADTPPAQSENTGCKTFPWRPNNTCGSGANGEMFMNFMDYSNHNCMNLFTIGQASRMMATLNTVRASLSTSNGCTVSNVVNPLANASRWYVDPDATGNGSGVSWTNAVESLQNALQNALNYGVTEIWVKRGTYTPSSTSDRTQTFTIPNGVKVYGGFVGTETALTGRNLSALYTTNATILSGDLLGNDVGFTNNAENSYTVVKFFFAPNSTQLDGCVINGGNNNPDPNSGYGGGVFNQGSGAGNGSQPTLSNCLIKSNFAYEGGGLYNHGGGKGNANMTLTNCTFKDNKASFGGGAIFNNALSVGLCSPTIDVCTFEDNISASIGGAVLNEGSFDGVARPVYTNCAFKGNKADAGGGAVYNWGVGDGIATVSGLSSPVFVNCNFTNNSVTSSGGTGGCVHNNAESNGKSSPVFKNCVFLNSQAESQGGAIRNTSSQGGIASPDFTNCSFYGNNTRTTANNGWGSCFYNYCWASTTSPTLTNCVLFGNGNNPFFNAISNGVGTLNVSVNYSLMDNSVQNFTGSNNVIAVASPFVANTDLHLNSCAAADIGNNAATVLVGITTDIEGNARIFNSRVDAGAYEKNTTQTNTIPTISGINASSVNDLATSFSLAYTSVTGAPNQFSITPTGTAMPNFVPLSNTPLTGSPLTIPIPASAVNTYNFNLTVRNSTTQCASGSLPFSLIVRESSPTIYVSTTALTAFTSYAGSASMPQVYTVSGVLLTENLTLTAPTNFEISFNSETNFANTLSLTPTAGTIATTSIFVRQKASAINGASGTITQTSAGATQKNVSIPLSIVANYTYTVTASATPSTVCNGESSTLKAVLMANGYPVNYSWTAAPLNFNSSFGVGNSVFWYNKITLTTNTFASNLWLEVQDALPSATNVRLALYTNNAGQPNTLIAASDPKSNLQIGTNLFAMPPSVLTTGTYWVAMTTDNFVSFKSNAGIAGANVAASFRNYSAGFAATAGPFLSGTPTDVAYGFGIVVTDPTVYTWSPSTTLSAATGSTVLAVPTNNTTYTASAVDNLGTTRQGTVAIALTSTVATIPTFTAVAPICSGTALSALPTTSNNGITGVWSPMLNNTTTTTYTFTPNTGQCAVPKTLTITVNPLPSLTLGTLDPITNASTSFTIPFSNPTGAPTTYAIATTGNALPNFVPLSNTALTASPLTIAIPSGTPLGTYNFNLTLKNSTTQCSSVLPLSVLVKGFASAINVSTTTLTAFASFTGSASAAQSYTVSAVDVSDNVVINAPTHFDISLNPEANFANTLTLTPVGGAVTSKTIWVRQKTTAINGASGTITHTCVGTVPKNVTIPVSSVSSSVLTLSASAVTNPVATCGTTVLNASVKINGYPTNFLWTKAGISFDNGQGVSNNFVWYNRIVLTNPTTASNLWLEIFYATPAATNARLALYTDNAGRPSTLIAASAPKNNLQVGSNTFPITPSVLAAGTYWVAFTTDDFITYKVNSSVAGSNVTMTFQPYSSGFGSTATNLFANQTGLAYGFGIVGTDQTVYTWSPSTTLTAATGSSVTASPTSNTTYTVKMTDEFGATQQATVAVVVTGTAVTPLFTAVSPICSGATLAALPTTSTNGITGTWSPALNNLATTTYTFAPAFGQCANPKTMTITVNPAPALTLGNISNVLNTNTSFSIPFSNVAGAATTYSIATTTGNALPNFVAVNNTPLSISPISVALPSNLPYGTFNFTLNISNGTCTTAYPFTLTVTNPLTERRGNALSFDGISNAVTILDNDNALTSYTLETWVYWTPNTPNDVQFLCSKANEQMEVRFGGIGNNGIRFIPTTGVFIDAPNALPTNEWVHLAISYDATATPAISMYVNGILVGSGTTTVANANTTNGFNIGKRGDNSFYFKGRIDEFRIWRGARTQSLIRRNMHLTSPTSAANLMSLYPFNETTPQATTTDNIGGFNGTVNGATWVTSGANVSKGTAFLISNPATATNQAFTGTDLTLNYGNTVGTGDVFAYRLEGEPTGTQVTGVNVFSDYYWVVNNFGTNKTGLNITAQIALGAGKLDANIQATPSVIKLHQRTINSGGNWNTPVNATTATSNTGNVVFTPLSNVTEFVVSKPIPTQLTIKMHIQGYYDRQIHAMVPVKANQGIGTSTTYVDDITVELRHPTTRLLVATATAQLQTNGTAVVQFSTAPSGSFYIAIKHRNALQTWSAAPQTVGTTPSVYDFTTAANKAFGSNMKQVEAGVFAFYSGDIDQDEVIDIGDSPSLYRDNDAFAFGYFATDINGDGSIDSTDFTLFYNNSDLFIYSIHP